MNNGNNKINNNNEVVNIRHNPLNNEITRKQEEQSNNQKNNYFDKDFIDTFSNISNKMMYTSILPNIIFIIGLLLSYKKK